jgi:D-lactate dehydrogenase
MKMLPKSYSDFYEKIIGQIPKDRVFTDPLRTLAYGTDASFYRLVPKVVIWTQSAKEVKLILKEATALGLPVVFRAAGTSLSGQALSDSILIVTSRDWNGISANEDKSLITLQASVLGASANRYLSKYGKKIGPDPASIDRAMIAGIVANNASGMCCGVVENSLETISDIKMILMDGTELDTSSKESREAFKKSHPKLLERMKGISQKIKNNKELYDKIVRKYSIKNVCGYSLNAFLKSDDPIDMIKYLMVGSEGTLAFIEEVTFRTVPDYKDKASALMVFETIREACEAVAIMSLECRDAVDAAEMMDRLALKSIENKPGIPDYVKTLTGDATAILVETRAPSKESLQKNIDTILEKLKDKKTIIPIDFTDKEEEYKKYWEIRKGVFPAVIGQREAGTTGIIEDIACPIQNLADMTEELQKLLIESGYDDSCIYGHALEGNFHFILNQSFASDDEVERYDTLMDKVAHMVAKKYDGSLKAEHGTGRNMAPYVEFEWGSDAYEIMKEIKELFDPKHLLNPDVILCSDKKIHLKNLKAMPKTDDIIDMCIECGFCESTCPSNMISLTPRQRTVSNRYMTILKNENRLEELEEFKKLYQYYGIDTCATCQLCSMACPVDIDTGNLTKKLRAKQATTTWKAISSTLANHYAGLLGIGRFALSTVHTINKVIPDPVMSGVSGAITKLSGGSIPQWKASLPSGNKFQGEPKLKSNEKVVYFSSCINRTMSNTHPKNDKEEPLSKVVIKLLERAGIEVIIPEYLDGLCCGMPFSSKGYKEDGKKKSDELEKALIVATQNGKYPVLCDMSPCTKTMIQNFKADIKIYDTVDFTHDILLNKLEFKPIDEPIVIHTTCSTRKTGLADKFAKIARACSTNVTIPENVGCCGFAGDRGFTFPELNKSALRHLKEEIPSNVKYAFSTSKTCEIGLSEESGLDYKSIFYLVEKVTR